MASDNLVTDACFALRGTGAQRTVVIYAAAVAETLVARSRRIGGMPIFTAVLCLFLPFVSAKGVAQPELVKLAVSEDKDIRFAHLTITDGLSPGQIRDVVQDDQGFIWFNTASGLNRYDGYQVKSYRRDRSHPNYPAASFLHHVIKDRAGYLWVSSNESLERFDPRTEISTRWPIDRNGPNSVHGPVLHINQDRAGIIWLATSDGLHRLDPATGVFRHYSHNPADPASLSSSMVRSTYEDREGKLWVCTLAGLDVFDPRTEQVTERIPMNVPNAREMWMLEDHSGVLWITYTSGNGLASWDRHSKRLTLYSFKDREPPGSQTSGVSGIHEDADGNLWLATYGSGLVKIDSGRRSALRYRNSLLDRDSINDDMLNSIFEDREGNIWVGSAVGGTNRFQRHPLPFQRYRHDPDNPQSMLRTATSSVFADSQNNVWIGSSSGLTRIDGKTGQYSFFRTAGRGAANLSNPFVVSIVEDRSGYMWFGTYGGGLNRYDPRTGKFAVYRHDPADPDSLSNDTVFALMVDHHGTLWAGTEDGLNRLEDPASGRFHSWKAAPAASLPQEVAAIVEDPQGVLWVVSKTLQRFEPATGRFTAYRFDFSGTGKLDRQSSATLVAQPTVTVNSFLAIDHSDVLWVATPNGLLRFNRQREEFTTYDERDGLPANSVLGIVEDHKGNLWVSTDGGLSRFDPKTKNFTNYYEADGLAGSAFQGFPVACRSRRGQMFFGNKYGLTSFWPEQIVENPSVPPVVITEFSLQNLPVAPGSGSLLAKSITYTPSLTLFHEQNLFSFEFAVLSYVDPARNQYRYMLEGLDRSWNPVGAGRRLATFTTLPAGDYTLRIQGSNNRGVWNEQGAALRLRILPPWWATWWFRGLGASIFFAMLGAAYQTRVQRLKRGLKQLRDMVETIPAMAWTARPDGTNEFVNKRWTEFTGLSAEDTARSGWMAAVHPEDHQVLLDQWRTCLNTGEPLEFEARVHSAASGEYRWLLARGVPMRDTHGKIIRWHGLLTDIQDRKQAEEERERRRQLETDLAHLSRVNMMGELTASIAHEVNQPLTGIVSNGSACMRWLAGDPPNVSEVREAVRDIVRDARRAAEVIARTRALSRRSPILSETLSLNETIREVLVLVDDKAKKDGVRIRTQFAGDLWPVSGDRIQLQQVVLNLVVNSIEALSGVDERARELLIATANIDADQVLVTVRDSGTGLDPNTIGKVFEPFYTTKGTGMGMGLSICRSIVQNHAGRLWASATDGRGATFQFSLPKHREKRAHP